ncbi:hypothetical protein FUMI01_04350 [Flavobacterium sp. UMI-01]|nr:hypothetical protein FUMI01_04350 [Flavobacterium sp. UMI-01]
MCGISFAQKKELKQDSTSVYHRIQQYSTKNKFTKLVHKLIFNPINDKRNATPTVKQKKHKSYDGKIIRDIHIVTLDPFGFSDSDTLKQPKRWEERTGNHLHLKSKKIAILNLLLFKKNSVFNAITIQETERLIRSQRFVSRVTITEKLSSKKSDSVDVYIRVLDSWSTIPKFQLSSNRISVGLNEKNFFGTGQQFDYRFTNRFVDGQDAHNLSYTIPNIKNSYTRSVFKYNINLDGFYDKGILIERPFYSSLTKWAGGIYLNQTFSQDSLQAIDLTYSKQNFKNNIHDFWLGKAFPLYKNDTLYKKSTNLILSGRFMNKAYTESPDIAFDPTQFYNDEKLMLIGIGINNRQFIEDKYIFRYGITEDVPIGQIYGLTMGYQYKNHQWRPYLGGQFSFGKYIKQGFISTNFEVGTYFNQSKTQQTAFSFQANYFTHLLEIGNWKIRQFVKPILVLGFNRDAAKADQLTINEDFGIQGFNSPIYGTNKIVLNLQTQTYSPKNIGGFRFNPFFNYTMALLGNVASHFPDKKLYSKIGIGAIISNDFLVFSSFQISLAYYPTIPLQGDSVFKTNAFETADFGFQSFELGKPKTIEFK